jgi:OOP family OmpA-OmpF porin
MVKRFTLLAAMLVLSGCAGVNIDSFQSADVKGSAFTQALVKEYRSFVKEEAAQYDWVDADHFAQKGLDALAGQDINPENPNDWNLPQHNVAEITNYYHRLSYILDNGAKKSSPALAAKALAKYDCWVEQQEENHQPQDIAECRGDFLKSFADLEKAEPSLAGKAKQYAASKPKVADVKKDTRAPQSGNGTVYFDFSASKLTADDIKTIQAIAKQAGKKAKVTVSGHTDTAGPGPLNKALSHRRAMAVRKALIDSGVPAKNIKVEAKGETDLAVKTGDNVREGRNRRAVIVVE